MARRGVSLALVLGVIAATGATAQHERRVLLVSADPQDQRIEIVREAVDFWNSTLDSLHCSASERLTIEAGIVAPKRRVLETYARLVAQWAGRRSPGAYEPEPPDELKTWNAEIVILLSVQDLMPFAWELPRSTRSFIAIRSLRDELEDVGRLRNIVAHELGHTLGLEHSSEPGALMCLPCAESSEEAEERFAPLTSDDLDRLSDQLGCQAVAR